MPDHSTLDRKYAGITSVALNRLSKVEKVRESADQLLGDGDLDGARVLYACAAENEAGVMRMLGERGTPDLAAILRAVRDA